MLTPKSIDHLVFRIANFAITERFYTALLGDPVHRAEDSLLYMAGTTRLFFTLAAPSKTPYNKESTGLNHLAFTVPTLQYLHTIQTQLNAANIAHSGIQIDPYGDQEFIWLDDPDGLRIEFYLRQE